MSFIFITLTCRVLNVSVSQCLSVPVAGVGAKWHMSQSHIQSQTQTQESREFDPESVSN